MAYGCGYGMGTRADADRPRVTYSPSTLITSRFGRRPSNSK